MNTKEQGYTQGYRYAKAEQSLEMIERDAEVRKPLVEAIKSTKALIGFLQSCVRSGESLNPKDSAYIRSVLDQADAALAQCKDMVN